MALFLRSGMFDICHLTDVEYSYTLRYVNYYLAPIGGGRGIVMPMSVCLCVCLSVFSQNFKV